MDIYPVSELRRNPAPIVQRVLEGHVGQLTRHNDVVLYLVPVHAYLLWAHASRGQPDAIAAPVGDIAAELHVTVAVVSAMVTQLCTDPAWGRNRVILAEDHDHPAATWVHRDAAEEIARQLAPTKVRPD